MHTIKIADVSLNFDADCPNFKRHASFHRNEPPVVYGIMNLVPGIESPESRMFEIGTGFGCGVVQYARMFPQLEIHSLNILPEQLAVPLPAGEAMSKDDIGSYARQQGVAYTQHYGDSRRFDFGQLGEFDVVMVDGCHEYEYVQADSRAAREMVRPGGIVIWHDYTTKHDLGQQVMSAIDYLDEAEFDGSITHVQDTMLTFWQKEISS